MIISRPLSEVAMEPIEWIWPGRLPRGALTLLEGDPGLGKSTLACDLVARVSAGRGMPGSDATSSPGTVLWLSGDAESPGATIRPRLEAAGVDPGKVELCETVRGPKGEDAAIVLPRDVLALEHKIEATGAVLLVIDPLVAFLGSGTDTHRDAEVRQALRPLLEMAERTRVAILAIRHLNKAAGTSAIYRGGGSIGFAGASRSMLLVTADPADPGRRVIASIKCNVAPHSERRAFAFAIETTSVPAAGSVGRVTWLGERDYTADQLVGATAPARPRQGLTPNQQEEVLRGVEKLAAKGWRGNATALREDLGGDDAGLPDAPRLSAFLGCAVALLEARGVALKRRPGGRQIDLSLKPASKQRAAGEF